MLFGREPILAKPTACGTGLVTVPKLVDFGKWRSRCTTNRRWVSRLENEAVLDRMAARLKARPEILDRRREIVEHPFAAGTTPRTDETPTGRRRDCPAGSRRWGDITPLGYEWPRHSLTPPAIKP
jgi:hypothetical protein